MAVSGLIALVFAGMALHWEDQEKEQKEREQKQKKG
jgi:hypothetical protein